MSFSNLIKEGKIHTDYYVDNVGTDGVLIDDGTPADDKTYSSNQIESVVSNLINNTPSDTTTYSSNKIENLLTGSGQSFFSYYYSFTRGTNNSITGFFSDDYVQIGWDGYDEIMLQQPTARSNVYAKTVSYSGGQFLNSSTMILSTNNTKFYRNSSTGHIEFWIQSDSDSTHPLYIVKLFLDSSSTADNIYFTIQKHLSS